LVAPLSGAKIRKEVTEIMGSVLDGKKTVLNLFIN
jgi:hypothetical protein